MMKSFNIKNSLTNFYDAFNNKKWKIVEECLSDNFSYFTDNCQVKNKLDFILFMQSDDWQSENFQLEELKISMSKSDDFALATYSTKFEGTSGGTKMRFQAIETAVFKVEQDKCKILHLHTTNKV